MIDLGQRFPDRQQGSNAEPFSVLLVRYGEPLDLTGATVTFRAVNARTTEVKISGTGSGSSNGVAEYEPTAGDLDTPGIYRCQMIATFTDGTVHRSEPIALRVLANP
jgi:hypothetical protein